MPRSARGQKAKLKKKKTDLKVVVVSQGKDWKLAAQVATGVTKKLNQKGMLPAVPFVKPVDRTDTVYQQFRLDGIKGIKAYKKGEFEQATRHFKKAIERLERLMIKYGPSLTLIRKNVRAYYYLGASRLAEADPDGAAEAFRVAATYDPAGTPSAKRFSPDVIRAFARAKKKISANRGDLIIRTPEPARLFIDGHDRGIVPKTVKNLPLGRHFFVLHRLGYLRVTKFIDIENPEGNTWKVNVSADPQQSAMPKFLSSVERELRTKRMAGPWVAKLAKRLNTKQLIVCRASAEESEASWYNAEKKRYKKRVRRPDPVPGKPPVDDITEALLKRKPVFDLGKALVSRCLTDADCSQGQCIAGKCVVSTPFYKKWWFWVAVGVGAAAAAATGALVATMPQKPIIRITNPN
jgi:tetratricopeptide (TPR) repeat protein